MTISDSLLEKLACPACKKSLQYEEKTNRLICNNCYLGYKIIDDVPVLLVNEAEKLKQG